MSFYTYVLKNTSTGKHYTGQTENLLRRLNEHNQGLLGRSTKNKGEWEIIYYEEFQTRAEAMKREKYFKTGAGRDFIKKQVLDFNQRVAIRRGGQV